jgi:hypothetical protein
MTVIFKEEVIMKKLFLVIALSLFVLTSNVMAEPFLVCDDPNVNEMITGYMLSFDGEEYMEVSTPLHYDLSHLTNGAHDVNVKAKNVWGEQSTASFLAFIKGVPSVLKGLTISID